MSRLQVFISRFDAIRPSLRENFYNTPEDIDKVMKDIEYMLLGVMIEYKDVYYPTETKMEEDVISDTLGDMTNCFQQNLKLLLQTDIFHGIDFNTVMEDEVAYRQYMIIEKFFYDLLTTPL